MRERRWTGWGKPPRKNIEAADALRERQRKLKREGLGFVEHHCPCYETLKERLRILEGWIRWERGEGPRGYLEKYKKIKTDYPPKGWQCPG